MAIRSRKIDQQTSWFTGDARKRVKLIVAPASYKISYTINWNPHPATSTITGNQKLARKDMSITIRLELKGHPTGNALNFSISTHFLQQTLSSSWTPKETWWWSMTDSYSTRTRLERTPFISDASRTRIRLHARPTSSSTKAATNWSSQKTSATIIRNRHLFASFHVLRRQVVAGEKWWNKRNRSIFELTKFPQVIAYLFNSSSRLTYSCVQQVFA